MKKFKNKTIVILVITAFVYFISCNEKKDPPTNEYPRSKSGENGYSSDPINNPDKFAWQVFIDISKPADPSEPEGETVWQKNWANVIDIFDNPNAKPVWDDVVGLPSIRKMNMGQPVQQQIFQEMLLRMGLSKDELSKLHKLSACKVPDSTLDETKMNREAFDFIVSKNLFNAEGVEAMFASKTKIDAPVAAKEIKAVWKRIKESDKPRFHYIQSDQKIYGLVALHIITKDLPNWTWATFEHIENECLSEAENNPALRSVDRYGKNPDGTMSKELKGDFIKNGMPEKWNYYLLRGTQVDFTTSTGDTTLLANTYTENGFTTSSSCITCHARATVGPYLGDGKLNRLSVFESRDPLLGNVGSPNPKWFYEFKADSGRIMKYLQTDFMWSIPFRVKRKSS